MCRFEDSPLESPVGAASGRLNSPMVRSTATVQKKLTPTAGIQSPVCSGYLLPSSRPEHASVLAYTHTYAHILTRVHGLMFFVGIVTSNITVSSNTCMRVGLYRNAKIDIANDIATESTGTTKSKRRIIACARLETKCVRHRHCLTVCIVLTTERFRWWTWPGYGFFFLSFIVHFTCESFALDAAKVFSSVRTNQQ